ncbi:hypothetical protein FEM48_Zijuj06G0111000 [Ziziphus jujuba var. spinosa]|uniref:Protein EXORDIUM-like n=1 Tax=Ziziphus jujuba var. spinosa TaxID=714518 RepID=A0A978V8X4_ZIZJJ|nr:hypothetical protein FEM48_Zijuj06G0111000 [Ziziphus jujuba var. spinosa]
MALSVSILKLLFVISFFFQISFATRKLSELVQYQPQLLNYHDSPLLSQISSATRNLKELVQDQTQLLKYHNGPLLSGKISINLIWYGKFKPSQRAIVSDFITSLTSSSSSNTNTRRELLFGKSITNEHIVKLASKGDQGNAINVVLTSSDVAVEGFCLSRCGTHGSALGSKTGHIKGKNYKFAYIWVGNSETQCPGQCAWPFHQPIYGPQTKPLIAPNNDVGLDGMIINLASLLAGTATNPFGNGFFQGPAEAPLEAASACPGVYGKGAYPGYAGSLLVDRTTGASYNANGVMEGNTCFRLCMTLLHQLVQLWFEDLMEI